jgi:hypothetical protein
MGKPREILINKGETFRAEIRWSKDDDITYKAITGVVQKTPLRLTVASHGIPPGWPCAITNVKGMVGLNAEANNVSDSDYHRVKVIDTNTIEFNDIDAAGFKDYVSGGYVQFQTPQDLTGHTARMDIKDKIGGTVLSSSEVDASPLDIITLTVDAVNFKTDLEISATDTAGVTFKKGVTSLEMVGPTGVVKRLKLTSTGADDEPDPVRVAGEVTT